MSIDPAIILIGAILPLIVALAKQTGWDKRTNSVVAIIVYALAVFLYMVQHQIPFTLEAFSENAAAITSIGFVAYKMFWDALGIDAAVTEKTTVVH